MIHIKNRNRVGKFTIVTEFFEELRDVLPLIYAKGIIFRASDNESWSGIEYTMICDDFRPLCNSGEIIPTYRVVVSDDRKSVKFEEV